MKFKLALILVTTLALTACGGSDVSAPDSTDANPKQSRSVKFKGSKLAPPQDIMNRVTGVAMVRRKGAGYMLPKKSNGKSVGFKNIMGLEMEAQESEGILKAFAERSTFTPTECRKSDERKYKEQLVIEPISCTGKIDTPKGSTVGVIIFHKAKGEWTGEVGKYSGAEWTEH